MFRRWAETTFAALQNPQYRILWFGTALAFLAFQMQWIVQSVVAFDLTGKNGAVGFVGIGMGVSTLIVSPFGGAIADRVSKRKLLLIGQSTIGASFFIVGLLILTDQITIIWLAVSTFVMGCVFSFIGPARQAWVGELLPRPMIPNGMALTQVAMTATRIVGPLIAGVLIAISFIGTGGAYIFMGLVFVVVVATLWRLPQSQPRPVSAQPKSVFGDLAEGWRHLQERPQLQLLAYSFILIVITGFSWQVVLPGLLENELDTNAERLWILLVVSSITGLSATIGLAGLAGSRFAFPLMFVGAALLGISQLSMAFVPNFFALCMVMLVSGAGTGAFQMLNSALLMRESEPAYYGRVMSLTMLAWGFNGVAGLPVGLLADRIGERETSFLLGIGVLVISAAATIIYFALNNRTPTLVPAAEPTVDVVGGE